MNYRTSDPESSKIAGQEAERSFAPTQRKGVLEFIKKHPNKTSAELGDMHEYYDRHTFARRLPELRSSGKAIVTGFSSYKKQQLWSAVE
jgi:hypothetical protein